MNDVDIKVGADTSAAAAGLAELRNYGTQAARDLTSAFAQAFAVGGIIAGFKSVIDKAHDLHHESERFAVDAQFLQLVSNAAKEDGVQLTTVARAMNLLEINTQKARDGNDKAINSFAVLGVSLEDIKNLSPQELFLKIADGVSHANDKTAAYAATATLLGTRNTELIPTLERGSQAILQIGDSMGKMSDETIKSLAEVHRNIEQLENQLSVGLGGALASGIKGFQNFVGTVTEMIGAFAQAATAGFRSVDRALHLDFAGAKKEWANFFDYVKTLQDVHADETRAGNQAAAEQAAKPPPPPGMDHIGLNAGEGNAPAASTGAGSSSAGGTGTSDIGSLYARLGKLNEDNLLKQLPLQERLKQLEFDRTQIQGKYARLQEDGLATTEDGLTTSIALAENQGKIADTQQAIDDEQAKYTETVEQARQAAADQVDAQEEQNQQLQDTLNFGSDIAQQMADLRDLQSQILDVTDQINQAWAEGDQETADTLTNLREQLDITEKIKQAALDKAQAEKPAGKSFNPYDPSTYSGYGRDATGGNFDPALGASTPAEQKRLEALELAGAITGHNALNFEQEASLKAGFLGNFNQQYAAQQAAMAAQQAAQVRDLLSGRSSALLLPGSAAAPQVVLDPLLAQLTVAKQSLAELQSIVAKLTALPGQHP